MKLLTALFVGFLFVMLAKNSIKKHSVLWYCFAFLLGLASQLLPSSAPGWLQWFAKNYITRGTLATAFFILVMYARVFPPKSKPFRTLMMLRAQLAIMGSLLILAHICFYVIHYYEDIFIRRHSLKGVELFAVIGSILMVLLLIPLAVTSFSHIHRRMKGSVWKKLQRYSYVFYGLIYLHIALLFGLQISRGNDSYCLELAIYTVIFGCYLVCRCALFLKNSRHPAASVNLRRLGIPAVWGICLLFVFFTLPQENVTVSADTVLSEEQTAAENYQDGDWVGIAFGYNDNVTVSVHIENSRITKVSVLSSEDDEPYLTQAMKAIPSRIVEAQSTEVDSVSGATTTSDAIRKATENALKKALAP